MQISNRKILLKVNKLKAGDHWCCTQHVRSTTAKWIRHYPADIPVMWNPAVVWLPHVQQRPVTVVSRVDLLHIVGDEDVVAAFAVQVAHGSLHAKGHRKCDTR